MYDAAVRDAYMIEHLRGIVRVLADALVQMATYSRREPVKMFPMEPVSLPKVANFGLIWE